MSIMERYLCLGLMRCAAALQVNLTFLETLWKDVQSWFCKYNKTANAKV